ncbi:Ankyrin-2 [Porphyridium purpureum]|uniref:Ankyrin-2 n=1 Tax=Porphyridium purpureum TaxID=35688 RepID=A0A5J4ZA89_PORPP|nr:Ankyrin-2 [Porphyridium purpureum]|eukprot:POR9699..scf295_1
MMPSRLSDGHVPLGDIAALGARSERHEDLRNAARDGNVMEVRRTLDQPSVDVDAVSLQGRTALMLAAMRGNVDCVRELLDRGARLDAKCGLGWSALIYAAMDGRDACVQLLLEKHAKPGVRGNAGKTALWVAARYGHDACVLLLLEHGADQTELEDGMHTPLMKLVRTSCEKSVCWALKHGADAKATRSYDGATAMHILASSSRFGPRGHRDWKTLNILQLLVRFDSPIGAVDECGNTALDLVAKGERSGGHQLDLLELFLLNGADINRLAHDKNGRATAIMELMWSHEDGAGIEAAFVESTLVLNGGKLSAQHIVRCLLE